MREIKNNYPDPISEFEVIEEEVKTVYGGKDIVYLHIYERHKITGKDYTSHFYEGLNFERVKVEYKKLVGE